MSTLTHAHTYADGPDPPLLMTHEPELHWQFALHDDPVLRPDGMQVEAGGPQQSE